MPKRERNSPSDTKPKVVVTFEPEEYEKLKKAAKDDTRTLAGQVRHLLKPILEEVAA